jgi:hypothetical protein
MEAAVTKPESARSIILKASRTLKSGRSARFYFALSKRFSFSMTVVKISSTLCL